MFEDLVVSKDIESVKNNHVFKVSNLKHKKTIPQARTSDNDAVNRKNQYNSFHLFTDMFDHFEWKKESLTLLSKFCLEDINKYLEALRRSEEWALKASDASGRYRGLFFFENDYWLGSKQACYEVNNEYQQSKKLPGFQFFVVNIRVRFPQAVQRVNQ